MDDRSFIAPQLAALYADLNAGRARRPFDFDPGRCMAPLPRACQLTVGAANGSHGDDEPPMVQAGSDALLGPTDDIVLSLDEWSIDFGAGLAVVTGDVVMDATPDELGDAWRDAKVHLPLRTSWNGHLIGQPDADVGMAFNFAQWIAHLARTRQVRAGSIVGSGVVSNQDASRGDASIAGGNVAGKWLSKGRP